MNKYRKYIPIIALVLVGLGVNLDKFGIDLDALSRGQSPSLQSSGNRNSGSSQSQNDSSGHQAPSYAQWSDTKPALNLWHIFEGEINRKQKPVGYHSRPGGNDPANAKVVSVRDKPNNAGIYTATIAIKDGSQWKEKFSSFFPDDMSRDEVIDVILHAYSESKNPKSQPWQGPSGQGFNIQGYTSSRGGINTAFPVYVR